MTIKTKDVDRFLQGKLKMVRSERKRHIYYQIRMESGRIPLPKLLMLSRGSGDVSIRNLKGLAEALGLTLNGFHKAKKCKIRYLCVLSCTAARILKEGIMQAPKADLEPIVYEQVLARLAESVELIMNDLSLEKKGSKGWNLEERAELDRNRNIIIQGLQISAFKDVAGRLLRWIESDSE